MKKSKHPKINLKPVIGMLKQIKMPKINFDILKEVRLIPVMIDSRFSPIPSYSNEDDFYRKTGITGTQVCTISDHFEMQTKPITHDSQFSDFYGTMPETNFDSETDADTFIKEDTEKMIDLIEMKMMADKEYNILMKTARKGNRM